MSEYLLHAKSIADFLNVAGSANTEDELIECLLDGLGPGYKEFTTAVHLRPSLSYDDCYDLLIQEENLIKKMSSLSLSSGVALAASRRSAGILMASGIPGSTSKGKIPIFSSSSKGGGDGVPPAGGGGNGVTPGRGGSDRVTPVGGSGDGVPPGVGAVGGRERRMVDILRSEYWCDHELYSQAWISTYMAIGEARVRLSWIVLERLGAHYLRVFDRDATRGEFVLLFKLRRSELSGMTALENTLQARIGELYLDLVDVDDYELYFVNGAHTWSRSLFADQMRVRGWQPALRDLERRTHGAGCRAQTCI
ncbi:hypothetical protein D8674_022428 [Pyrus ussuriensis x Pyrus communis]|uniref:Uncharacterized protein n=1 Tax=Pyrus ussuriensis x Pyrus communis TaxID=2448454 RepID=A0A5N5GRJ9_9ROSA|nr:hypothetical protein D8674_022428 [Pyrus ussuriensis x Pyrus communis]